MDTEAGRRAVARGLSWRDEALTTLLETAGLDVPREGWPLLGITDAHPRLQHCYVARHVEDARLWDTLKKARQEIMQRLPTQSQFVARGQKPPVVLLRTRGAAGRRVGRYALLEAEHAQRAIEQLPKAGVTFPVVMKEVEGIAPRVIPALQELVRTTIGPEGLVHVVYGFPKAPRPNVALLTFEGYVTLVSALVEASIW